MYAIVRDSQFDPEKLANAQAELNRFQSLHEGQPGYEGTVLVDIGAGRVFIVTMWKNEDLASAGRDAIGPQVRHMLKPLMTRESRLVGTGNVLATDLMRGS
jgi:heme-degrading monooxygenase HmoA